MKKRKVLFITTGGTIACVETEKGLAPALTSEELVHALPEISELCEAQTLPLYKIDSTDIAPMQWLGIAKAIEEYYEQADAFIICHGTDTLAYTAAALSYLVRNSKKPIILTGAQHPISADVTDAKKNLRDSVIAAIDEKSQGVMVVFGGHVIAGTRAKKNKTISYDAFSSINFPALAQVQGDRLVRHIPPEEFSGEVEFFHNLNEKIFLLKLTPGLSPSILDAIFQHYDCIIVESFGVGGIPQNLVKAFSEGLSNYQDTRKVLIMTTQVTYEGSDVGIYEVGRRVKDKFSFLEAHDMTIEAVITKSMWLLAQGCETFGELQAKFYERINFDTFFN